MIQPHWKIVRTAQRLLRTWPALFMMAMLIVNGSPILADVGDAFVLPQPPKPFGPKPANSGLNVRLNTRGVSAPGYRPVTVTIQPSTPGPATANQSFKIELQPKYYHGLDRAAHRVTAYLELKKGSNSATTTVLIPQTHPWGGIRITVSEDGEIWEELSEDLGMANFNNSIWSEANPSILFIDTDAPDLTTRMDYWHQITGRAIKQNQSLKDRSLLPQIQSLVNVLPTTGTNFAIANNQKSSDAPFTDEDILKMVLLHDHMAILPPEELPQQWLGYTCFDVVVISWDDLQAIAAKKDESPESFRALRDWLLSGPTLCVYGLGETHDPQMLRALEKLLELPPLDSQQGNPNYSGWTLPNSAQRTGGVEELTNLRKNMGMVSPYGITTTFPIPTPTAPPPNNIETAPAGGHQGGDEFIFRQAGLGRLVVLRGKNPFPGSANTWPWLMNSLTADRYMWYRRHGISLHRPNNEFWNWTIPGVGKAPVNTFLFLISVFVVVIGPINYYVLKQRHRLYLLLLTVPAGAAVVTLSLFAYAIIADGLHVRARVRSFSMVDQAHGRVVSWSRQTYYAGLSPKGGLTFPEDTAVYPLEHFPPNVYETNRRRDLEWDAGQHLTSGYLLARTTTQFLAIRCGESSAKLQVGLSKGEPNEMTVHNKLGAPAEFLLVANPQGELFVGENVGVTSPTPLNPIKLNDARSRITELVGPNRPGFPEGYESTLFDQPWSGRGRYGFWYGNGGDYNAPAPTTSSNLMERNITTTLALAAAPEPGSYIAILKKNPDVPFGTEATEEASFHVVVGRWK